ncbi:hypothetical protein PTNB29_00408 [Pyrenophora teres f. teres]|nr:hypothetical protein PTNB29_00408 [Pyrenophora teres f. teres]
MYLKMRTISFVLAQSALVRSARAFTSLYTSPLYALQLQTSLDGGSEYASWTPLQHPDMFPQNHNQETEDTDNSPWTHPPICTPVLQTINSTLCIYTSTTYSSNRGISIFTTPSLAKTFASLPAFTSPQPPLINTPTNAYTATAIPGKGLGMLAARDLNFGDVVTAHTPTFVAYLEVELSTLERERWWRRAVEQLPKESRDAFLDLATVYGDERVKVQDVVKSNTFRVDVGGGVGHLAIWPETSRANHGCAPNAQYVIDPEHLTQVVRVTRPIAAGEEITIAYTTPLEPTPLRQKHLQTGFHFNCTCSRCTSPTSDATLSRMETIQSQLNDWSATSPAASPSTSLALVDELMGLYRSEGLEGFMDLAYGYAALAYSAVGDRDMALRYAELAKEAILLKDGKWVANFGVWEELIGNVDGHWSWMMRKGGGE